MDNDLDQCVTLLACQSNMTRTWFTLTNGLRIHVLTRPSTTTDASTNAPPSIVFIHGVISSSIHVMHAVRTIPKDITVYVIDLPGYGVSSNLHVHPAYMAPVQLLETYADIIAETIRYLSTDDSVHLVGHSFGAMFAIYTQLRHPKLVSEMTLMKPAGLFPTLNAYGYYFGIAFHFGWVQSVLKHMMPARVHHILKRLLSPMNRFNVYTLAHPSSNAYLNPSRFITFKNRHVIWNTPCIRKLCEVVASPCKVRVFFGEKDPLIPIHQRTLLEYLFDGYTDCILVSEGHEMESSNYVFLPENKDKGVLRPTERSQRLIDVDSSLHQYPHIISIYGGSLSTKDTEANMRRYYADLKRLFASE